MNKGNEMEIYENLEIVTEWKVIELTYFPISG